MKPILEISVDSLASARAAIAGGADRLELCSALPVGGLTPFAELLQQIRAESDIAVRCLIRPRAGDFLYSPEETALMAMQIRTLSRAGADGFVFGSLNAQGFLDGEAMKPLLDAAEGKGLTLHRCIDVSADLEQTYLDAKELGFDTVLTSGGKSNCVDGMDAIGKLLRLQVTEGGPAVMPGAGINAGVISRFLEVYPGIQAFHASCKFSRPSGMEFRRADVPMGLPGFDEWSIPETSVDAVVAANTAASAVNL